MLQINITTKQELMKLLKAANISRVLAKDIHQPDDLNDLKKSALAMMRDKKQLTAIIVAS